MPRVVVPSPNQAMLLQEGWFYEAVDRMSHRTRARLVGVCLFVCFCCPPGEPIFGFIRSKLKPSKEQEVGVPHPPLLDAREGRFPFHADQLSSEFLLQESLACTVSKKKDLTHSFVSSPT